MLKVCFSRALCNLLNIYHSEKCFKQKLVGGGWRNETIFLLSVQFLHKLQVLRQFNRRGKNVPEMLWCAHISHLA